MIFKQGSSIMAIGRLTRDPEKASDRAPTKAGLAVGDKENVQFINLVAWYGRGEKLLDAHKGDMIMIGGTEKKSTYYSDKRQEEVERVEIDCEAVMIIERKTGASSKPPSRQNEPIPDMQETDEDMPF